MMTPKLPPRTIQERSTSERFHLSDKKKAGPGQSSKLCFSLVITVLLGALASAGVSAAQEPPRKNTTQDSGILLRQTVRRVRVDVVVTDAHGQPVTGLQESDFRVAEDGNPQSIRQFEYHRDESAETALPKRPPLPAHTFMNVPEAPEHGPLMVVLYDVLNTQVGDQLFARKQMVEFLKRSAGRRIAIFVLGDRLRLLQGFTSDTELLVSAVNRTGGVSLRGYRSDLTGYPVSPTPPPGSPTPMSGLPPAGGRMTDMARWEMLTAEMNENERQSYASELLQDRVKITLDALVQIGRYLSGVPSRKNLIWYSGSFPAAIMPDPVRQLASAERGSLVRDDSARSYSEQIEKATNLLNTAEVSIYPIDARGLLMGYPPFAIRSAEFTTMDVIGEQTGGRAFYSTNGLKEALETAADEGSSYYSLLYAPANAKFDGSVRKISVRIGHGHYNLAYRRSYIASDVASIGHEKNATDQDTDTPDQLPVSTDSTTAAAQFGAPPSHQLVFVAHMDAVGTPAPATAEQMAALAPYREKAAKVMHKKFVSPAKPVSMQQYVIQYGVPVSQLDLPQSANGVYHSDLSMAVLAFSEDGETLWGTKTELKDEIPASKIDKIRKDGFQAIQTFFVPMETAVVRLMVRDEHSERIGSMEIRLPLPPDQQKSADAQ
jgi:VWFA-related protein